MIKHSKKAQRADLINWLQHVIDMNEPDLTNGPTDMEIEIPVEIDDKTTWDLIETNMRDRGIRFKVDYTDKTEDNNYYYMYIWKQDNLNSSSSMDYTWEINTKDFQFGTQRGYITPADIDAFVGELISTYECTATHPTKDTWYLTDLSFSDYEDLERNYWKEVGYYISAKSENVNSSKRGAKMIKRANKLNSAVGTQFDEKAFDKYLDSLVDDCLEAIMEQGVEAVELEAKVPGYDSDWCAAELTVPMNKAINKMKPIIREYYKAVYFGNKN